jgi:hypothetical protein
MKWGKMTSKSNMKYHIKKIFSRATNFLGEYLQSKLICGNYELAKLHDS